LQVSAAVVTSNASLGSKVMSALAKEPKLQGSNVIVSVSNLDGTILLSGTVAQKAQEKLAVQLAKRQAKKSKVVSQLKIQTPRPVSKPKKKAVSDECCR
jgi:osmotically-inducible protein OsmY